MACLQNYTEINYYILAACSLLSALCSIFIIVVCLIKKLYQTFAFRIVLYMALNDLIRCSVNLIPFYMDHMQSLCKPLGYIVGIAFLSNISWAASISVTLYQVLINETQYYESSHKYWMILSYIIIPILEALPFITDSYGYYSGLCGMKQNFYGNIWRFAVLHGPAWLFMALSLYIYVRLYCKLKKIQTQPAKSIIFDRGYIYTIIVVFVLMPLTILRILEAFFAKCELEMFTIFTYAILSSHGLLNFLAFISNKAIRIAIRRKRESISYLEINDYLTGSSFGSIRETINGNNNMWGW